MYKFAKKFLIIITLFSLQIYSNDEHISSPELIDVVNEKKESEQDIEKEKTEQIDNYLEILASIYPYVLISGSAIVGLNLFNKPKTDHAKLQKTNPLVDIDEYEDEMLELDFVKTDIKDISGSVPAKIDQFIKQINDSAINNEIKDDYCNRMILYGPTGNGKTILARKIAEATNSELIEINGHSIVTKFVEAGPNTINNTFETALNKNKKVVIFINGICTIATKNNFPDGIDPYKKTLDTLCTWLEKTKNNPNIIFLGETLPIDYFAKKHLVDLFKPNMVEILNPNAKMREEVINFYIKTINSTISSSFKLDEKEISNIARKTLGMSIRAIRGIVYYIYRHPTENIDNVIERFKPRQEVKPEIPANYGFMTIPRLQAQQITANGEIIIVNG